MWCALLSPVTRTYSHSRRSHRVTHAPTGHPAARAEAHAVKQTTVSDEPPCATEADTSHPRLCIRHRPKPSSHTPNSIHRRTNPPKRLRSLVSRDTQLRTGPHDNACAHNRPQLYFAPPESCAPSCQPCSRASSFAVPSPTVVSAEWPPPEPKLLWCVPPKWNTRSHCASPHTRRRWPGRVLHRHEADASLTAGRSSTASGVLTGRQPNLRSQPHNRANRNVRIRAS
jgi:hypothetical protein